MTAIASPVSYRFGRFELQPDERRLLAAGAPVAVGPRAFDLLVALVSCAGHLVTKDELLHLVWPKVIVEEAALQMQVSSLRKILGPDAIATISRRGYRFTGEVTCVGMTPTTPVPIQKHNLPHQLTSFIGREKEIAQLKKLLNGSRLLTLTGAGGCGKTRLAMQVAADMVQEYPDGIWLVELAALIDPGLVPQTVANVLGVKEQPGKNLTEKIAEYLASKRLLLVVDNAEHLLEACAQLADTLLRRCAQLVILVTSRERLGTTGELTYRVPSLSVPDANQDATPEQIAAYESARLFIERARLQQPHFAISTTDAAALASICRRLDGIALAIELAAPRVRSMSMEELSRHLDQRFGLLTGGSRTALPRHRTLRSLIDWSYDLLNEAEKALLCRVSVFSGGWTLNAAEQVCSGKGVADGDILDLLTSLADKNLVLAEQHAGATRYRLLETVFDYAKARLRQDDQEAPWRNRHLTYFVAMAEEAEKEIALGDQSAGLDWTESEYDNLRGALTWSSSADANASLGLRLAAALWRFWSFRGYLFEGRSWLAEHLASPTDPSVRKARARALNGAGVLARIQGDYVAARQFLEESLAIQRDRGDRPGIAASLSNLGTVSLELGEHPAAQSFIEQGLAIYRELGDRRGTADQLSNLGAAMARAGDFPAARVLHEESLAIRRKLGDRRGTASSLMNLAMVARNNGDLAAARELYEASEAMYQELGDPYSTAGAWRQRALVMCDQADYKGAQTLLEKSLASFLNLGDRRGICDSLYGLAYVFSLRDPRRAAILWAAGERLREELGMRRPPIDRSRDERQVGAARAALGDETAFDLSWQEGRAMNLEHAVQYALEVGSSPLERESLSPPCGRQSPAKNLRPPSGY